MTIEDILTTFLNTDAKDALIQPGNFSCMEPETWALEHA